MGQVERLIASAALRTQNVHSVSTDPAVRFDADSMTHKTCEVDVINQQQTGTCWIQAGLVYLSSLLKHKDDDKVPRFSSAYLSVHDKLGKAEVFLKRLGDDMDERSRWHLMHSEPVQDGGTWPMFAYLVNTFGLVPHDAMPPTYQSEHTAGVNRYINLYLKSVANEVRNGGVEAKAVLAHVNEALLRSYGPLPTQATLHKKYQAYIGSPREIGQHVLPHAALDCVMLAHAPDRVNGTYIGPHSNAPGNVQQDIFEVVDIDVLVNAVISQLTAKIAVWFTAEVRYDFSDKRGIAHTKLYDVGAVLDLPIADIYDKAARMKNGNTAPVHAMLLTAVKLDKDGSTPLLWRMQNSWGKRQRDRGGFITASHEWFKQHVFQVVVRRAYARVSPKPHDATSLPSWDIFATVANSMPYD